MVNMSFFVASLVKRNFWHEVCIFELGI